MTFVRPVLFLNFSLRLQEKSGGGKIVLTVVEAVPAGIKSPAADDSMRTSTGGKCGFGASAPFLARTSPMFFREL